MTQHRSIKRLRPFLFIITTSTGNVSPLSLKQGGDRCKSKTRLWSLFPWGHSQAVPKLDKHTLNVNTQSVIQMIQPEPFQSCVTNHIPIWVYKSQSADVPHGYCPVHNTHIYHCNAYRWIDLNWNRFEELKDVHYRFTLSSICNARFTVILWRTVQGLINSHIFTKIPYKYFYCVY